MPKEHKHMRTSPDAFVATSSAAWASQLSREMPEKAARILAGKSSDGLDLLPLCTAEHLPEPMPSIALKKQPSWEYHQQINLADQTLAQANTRLLEALQAGVPGLDFHFAGYDSKQTPDYAILLKEVKVAYISTTFHLDTAQHPYFDAFLSYIQDSELLGGTLYLMLDEPGSLESNTRYLARLISDDSLPGFRFLGVSGLPWSNAGATAVQELAFTLSLLVQQLDQLTDMELPVDKLWQRVEIELATDSRYFINIAKFRAMHILLSRLASAYQTPLTPDTWHIRATSAAWNKTLYDPVSNMLRNTSEAMGAVTGGCYILSLLPHDDAYEQADGFGQRMARNVSNILAHEAHLDKVADPAAGSYYIEHLTHQLVSKAWEDFVLLEKAGGFAEASKKGVIQQKLQESRQKKQEEIDTRQRILAGATRYVNPQESISQRQLKDSHQQKYSNWEALRLRADHHTEAGNARPAVSLLIYYPPQEVWAVNARVAFIADLLASAGILAQEFSLSDEVSLGQALQTYEVLIFCSSSGFYHNTLPDLWQQHPALQNKTIWLAGKPSEVPQTTAWPGLQGFIYAGANVYEILTDIQKQLNV